MKENNAKDYFRFADNERMLQDKKNML